MALSACGPARNQFAPACPVPGLVKPLDDLSRYNGASRDMRDLIIHASITNVAGKCQAADEPGKVETTVIVSIDLVRGPAMRGQTYVLPLFVAITDADAIRDKNIIGLTVEFPPNVDTTNVQTQPIRMEIPVTPQKTAAAYGIIAGFQLTPDELAFARRSGRR
jgi:hypothetical protein